MKDFTVTIQNYIEQLDHVDFDIIVTHDAGIIPEQRISKNFDLKEVDIDDTFLQDIIEQEVERIINEWNELNK